jgi:hypothetical protein
MPINIENKIQITFNLYITIVHSINVLILVGYAYILAALTNKT